MKNLARAHIYILDRFSRSHHRSSLITAPSLVQPVSGKHVKRWNFRKTDWDSFKEATNNAAEDLPPEDTQDCNAAYAAYCNIKLGAAKQHIPRGLNKNYVSFWDKVCEELVHTQKEAKTREEVERAASIIINLLNEKRMERWTETVESIGFNQSSSRAWQTINRLRDRSTTPSKCSISANAIAMQLLKNGRFEHVDKYFARTISH